MGKLGLNGSLLLMQIIHFGLLLWLLNHFLYKPVQGVLEKRRKRIEEALAAADAAKMEAEQQKAEFEAKLEAERRAAQEKVAEATRSSEKIGQEILAQAKAEAEEIRAQALAEAEKEKERLLRSARKEIAELALLAAKRVVGESMSTEHQRALVDEFLAGELK